MGKLKVKNKKGTVTFSNSLGKYEWLNQEEWKILVNGAVAGLLPVMVERRRKKTKLCVDLTGLVPLSMYFQNKLEMQAILTILWGITQITLECERHGLLIQSLCWDAQYILIDQEDGKVKMVYWPVSSLEQSTDAALHFFESFIQIMKYNGMLRKIYDDYKGYFYQRSVFDLQCFYRMMISIMEHWKDYNERKSKMKVSATSAAAVKTDDFSPAFSGWLERPSGEKLWMNEKQTTFGRDRTMCDYVVSESVNVSRRHAAILYRENKYYLMDMGSKNGTYLNEQKLNPGTRYELKDGDKIKIAFDHYQFRMVKKNCTVSIHHI